MPEIDEGFDNDLRNRFPDLARMAATFPELGQLMRQALREGWQDNLFLSKVRETNWWRERSGSKRLWDIEADRDPAAAQRRRDQRRNTIIDRASTMGIRISDADVDNLVEQSLAWDYSDGELDNFIVGFGEAGAVSGGTAAASAQQIIALGRDYLMNVSHSDAEGLALRMLKGQLTLDGVKSIFTRQAQQAFPQFSDQLDSGITIKDATAGVRGHVARILEMDENEIDLNNDRWTDLIDHVDEKGNHRMMTRGESGRWARSQSEYRRTDQARLLMGSVLQTVGTTMGKIA